MFWKKWENALRDRINGIAQDGKKRNKGMC
jgi:hypothetical protein